jgi:hypothetical protein
VSRDQTSGRSLAEHSSAAVRLVLRLRSPRRLRAPLPKAQTPASGWPFSVHRPLTEAHRAGYLASLASDASEQHMLP